MPNSTENMTHEPRGLFALFKGESGSAKTVSALSFPNPHVQDFDRKMPAIALKHYPGKEIRWDAYSNIDEVYAYMNWAKSCYPYISEEKCEEARVAGQWPEGFTGENYFPYETEIGDTLTSLSQLVLKSVDDAKGQNVPEFLKHIHTSAKGKKSVELRGYDSYNAEDNFLKDYIDTMKFLWARPGNPHNVILCAHVLQWESINNKQVRRIVTAGKGIAVYIPAQFDDVYHFYSEASIEVGVKSRRLVCTDAVGDDYAKTAYRLPSHFDVTSEGLYDKISRFVNIGKGEDFVTDDASKY